LESETIRLTLFSSTFFFGIYLLQLTQRDQMSLLQDFEPRIHMAHSDFINITKNGELCDEDGHVRLARSKLKENRLGFAFRAIPEQCQSNTVHRPLTIPSDSE
jgi:hypothetical protein